MIKFEYITKGQELDWLENHMVDEYYVDDEDDEDCSYEDIEAFILSGFFGFCGCGQPDITLEFIAKGLNHIDERMKRIQENRGEGFEKAWEKIQKEELEIFGSNGSAYFFYYWCDKEGLTEHGGSVPGWLTEKGYCVLNIINIAIQKMEK